MNKVILMGRLTRTPEMRQTQSGATMANFSIAVNRRFQKDQTDFINCVAWRQNAEFICRWFEKGNMIAVIGSLQQRKYTDNEGKERTVYEVVVDEAYFTSSKAEAAETGYNHSESGFNGPSASNDFGADTPPFDQGGFGVIEDTDDDLPF